MDIEVSGRAVKRPFLVGSLNAMPLRMGALESGRDRVKREAETRKQNHRIQCSFVVIVISRTVFR